MVIGLFLVVIVVKDVIMNGSIYDIKYFIVVMLILLIMIIFNMFFKGFLGLILIFLGIVGGYIIVCLFGIVKFSGVMFVYWFSLFVF